MTTTTTSHTISMYTYVYYTLFVTLLRNRPKSPTMFNADYDFRLRRYLVRVRIDKQQFSDPADLQGSANKSELNQIQKLVLVKLLLRFLGLKLQKARSFFI